ncbi:hypothetical protein STAFG_3510 [Streptomyces afghaniensis 772]|uniref:Uncharacterized protein n=1 Tax=Streptomyces afghaniensis 772 TaxID=1283301 RepID=S4NM46_9ACTN|nr:hypothetical protein STAFG_3510 [Streptomyces afghaniensis 772]
MPHPVLQRPEHARVAGAARTASTQRWAPAA